MSQLEFLDVKGQTFWCMCADDFEVLEEWNERKRLDKHPHVLPEAERKGRNILKSNVRPFTICFNFQRDNFIDYP